MVFWDRLLILVHLQTGQVSVSSYFSYFIFLLCSALVSDIGIFIVEKLSSLYFVKDLIWCLCSSFVLIVEVACQLVWDWFWVKNMLILEENLYTGSIGCWFTQWTMMHSWGIQTVDVLQCLFNNLPCILDFSGSFLAHLDKIGITGQLEPNCVIGEFEGVS